MPSMPPTTTTAAVGSPADADLTSRAVQAWTEFSDLAAVGARFVLVDDVSPTLSANPSAVWALSGGDSASVVSRSGVLIAKPGTRITAKARVSIESGQGLDMVFTPLGTVPGVDPFCGIKVVAGENTVSLLADDGTATDSEDDVFDWPFGSLVDVEMTLAIDGIGGLKLRLAVAGRTAWGYFPDVDLLDLALTFGVMGSEAGDFEIAWVMIQAEGEM